LAQDLSSEEFGTLLELRKALSVTAPRRQRRARTAKAPRAAKVKAAVKAPAVAAGNGGEPVKRGPGRPRKAAVRMIPVEGAQA
jgi:hypothetical protein